MFNTLICHENSWSSREAIVFAGKVTSWGELANKSRQFYQSQGVLSGRRVGLCFHPVPEVFASLAALDKLRCDVFLLDSSLTREDLLRFGQDFKLGAIVGAFDSRPADGLEVHELPNEEAGSQEGSVTILTSGTTGKPKAARHTWASLCRPVRKTKDNNPPRWLLSYRPHLYAGLQVMLQCFVNQGTLVVPEPGSAVQSIAELMVAATVQFVSATPSYWRQILMSVDDNLLKKLELIQITLGGEVVDQQVLDNLKKQFPQARVVHIYATTELGRCFSVTDGRAGFPVRFLKQPSPDGVELRIDQGELLVRSANAMRFYDPYSSHTQIHSDWFKTEDLVDLVGDRVYFIGRRSDMINVGGNKVHPIEIERVIRSVPGVFDVRVYGRSSSIVGELVACEVVPNRGQPGETLKDAITAQCLAQLAAHQRPRLIQIVDQIALSEAGKRLRRTVS